MDSEKMTIEEVSKILRVSQSTLRNWHNNGSFPSADTTPGGHRRYRINDIQFLMKGKIVMNKVYTINQNPNVLNCQDKDMLKINIFFGDKYISDSIIRSDIFVAYSDEMLIQTIEMFAYTKNGHSYAEDNIDFIYAFLPDNLLHKTNKNYQYNVRATLSPSITEVSDLSYAFGYKDYNFKNKKTPAYDVYELIMLPRLKMKCINAIHYSQGNMGNRCFVPDLFYFTINVPREKALALCDSEYNWIQDVICKK